MTPNFIIDVSEADFEYEVIAYSQHVPVVVDFWAEWCGPCRTLGPLLEKLAIEGQGNFRLAKVNVDENPNLATRYAVRSIPNVKAFRNGAVIGEFFGAQPEGRLREFLRQVAPTQDDLALEKATSLLDLEKPLEAEPIFRQVLQHMPGNPTALLGLCRSLLWQGQGREALQILEHFPPSREFSTAEILLPLARALAQLESSQAQFTGPEDPLDAAYENALRLIRRGNFPAAMDGLLDVLRENKRYREGAARQILVALFAVLGEQNPLTREYRAELASILF